MKMKGGLVISCVGLLCILMMGMALAEPMDIYGSITIQGEGTFDRNILLQTHSDYDGQKYNEEIYTPSLGMQGPTYLNYTEEFSMVLDNETMIDVISEGTVLNTKSSFVIKNYDMGVMQSHSVDGNYVIEHEYLADEYITYQKLDGKIEGDGEIYNLIKCPINKTYIIKDKTEFEGNFKIDIENEVAKIDYPASESDSSWLLCP